MVLCVSSVLQICKRSIIFEDSIRKDGECGGIDSCILIFDPRALFTGVLIQRMEAHFGSYHPPGNSTEVSWFLFVVGLDVY